MDIYLEIFGYIGTALVVISMLMTSVVKLRVINMCGGVISTVYSICYSAWAIVVMNIILIIINFSQVVIYYKNANNLTPVRVSPDDSVLLYFLDSNLKSTDASSALKREECERVYLIYSHNEIAGAIAGDIIGDSFSAVFCFAQSKYSLAPLVEILLSHLSSEGITRLKFSDTNAKIGLSRLDRTVLDGTVTFSLPKG